MKQGTTIELKETTSGISWFATVESFDGDTFTVSPEGPSGWPRTIRVDYLSGRSLDDRYQAVRVIG